MKKKNRVFAVGRRGAVEARTSNRRAVWTEWTEAKPGHGVRGGRGRGRWLHHRGGRGGQKSPLMSIYGIKDNGGAAEQGPCH